MTGQKNFGEKINFSSKKLGTKILKRFLATLVQRCTVFDHEGFKYYLTLFSRFGERQSIFSHKQIPGGWKLELGTVKREFLQRSSIMLHCL
jgi:hypothetical protein